MIEIPSEFVERAEAWCRENGKQIVEMIGYGIEGFVWRVGSADKSDVAISVVKVIRREQVYQRELAVYRRLAERSVRRLAGFSIPFLLDYDDARGLLELSLVFPPFLLDFGAATLDRPPADFNPDDAAWQAEKQRLYGRDWPDVPRLLDALRQYGVHYPDVHLGNIRPRP